MYNRDLVCETLRWEKGGGMDHVMVQRCAENRPACFFSERGGEMEYSSIVRCCVQDIEG
jgi:tRNA-dihydrouridine synthase